MQAIAARTFACAGLISLSPEDKALPSICGATCDAAAHFAFGLAEVPAEPSQHLRQTLHADSCPAYSMEAYAPLFARLQEELLAMRFICKLIEERGVKVSTAAGY